MGDNGEKKRFWDTTWFLWLMLIFCFPIGLGLLWFNTECEKSLKIKLSIGFGIFFLIAMFSGHNGDKQKAEPVPQKQEQVQQVKEPPKEEPKKEEAKKEETKYIPPICPRAGIGDSVDTFKRAVPGRNTTDMTYDGKDGVGAIFTSGKVSQVTVLRQAVVNGRHDDLSVKDYYPTDAVLVEDKGADNDQPGSWRWWSVYHSDKLAESMPSSNGNFVIMQRLYDSGKVNFVISIGDHL